MFSIGQILCYLILVIICPTTIANPIIIDTDLGPDDWQAITYIFAQPGVNVKVITIEADGENDCKQGYPKLLTFLKNTNHQNIPVACGNDKPLRGHHHFPKNWHLEDKGFFGITVPKEFKQAQLPRNTASKLIINTLSKSKKPLTIIALGPMTNLAQSIRENRQIFLKKVKSIYATTSGFNQLDFTKKHDDIYIGELRASWNIYIDPLAAAIVFNTPVKLYINMPQAQQNLSIKPVYLALRETHNRNYYQNLVFLILQNTLQDLFVGDQLTALLWHRPDICQVKLVKPIQFILNGKRKSRLATQCLSVSQDIFTQSFLNRLK